MSHLGPPSSVPSGIFLLCPFGTSLLCSVWDLPFTSQFGPSSFVRVRIFPYFPLRALPHVPLSLLVMFHLGSSVLSRLGSSPREARVAVLTAKHLMLSRILFLLRLYTTVLSHWGFSPRAIRVAFFQGGKPAATESCYPSYGARWVF